nr:MAG TPA: hypothetical protein [Caudoviricetes sp.]
MKDAILKGTGDSRYLKSKIPTGTTWEQALAMLNAGTFPVDLNGINTEGFQQVGTPLNKANLLKDAVVSKLGMIGDKTPNDMFGVLADCGNLHVWRKTVKTSSPINATYTIDEVTVDRTYVDYNNTLPKPGLICWTTSSCEVTASTSFTLDPITGIVTQDNPTRYSYAGANNFTANDLLGKYVRLKYPNGNGPAKLNQSLLYYIPSDASITMDIVGWFYCDKLQYVNVTPYIPAGTHVTYPVSTNRNAYQEGSDEKPAWYTLGDVMSGSFGVTNESTPVNTAEWTYVNDASGLIVSEDGTVSMSNSTTVYIAGNDDNAENKFSTLRGKYAKYLGTSNQNVTVDLAGAIIYFPNDTIFTRSGAKIVADRYQPVTGYPAITAGTTIEYLGCLGDKARVQVLSYVGTETYGVDHPSSVTANFPIKILYYVLDYNGITSFTQGDSWDIHTMHGVLLTETYVSGNVAFTYSSNSPGIAKKSADGKTFYWYHSGPSVQLNEMNHTYYFLAIG